MPLRRCSSLPGSTGASPYVGVWRMRRPRRCKRTHRAAGVRLHEAKVLDESRAIVPIVAMARPRSGLFYSRRRGTRDWVDQFLWKFRLIQLSQRALVLPALRQRASVNRGTGSYDQRNKWATAVLALRGLPAMEEFVFKVSLRAIVRVRAADESVARNVVPTVLGAPGSTEIALANQNHVALGRDATVTGVEFSMVGPIKSSKS
jgi:hypothetical protein